MSEHVTITAEKLAAEFSNIIRNELTAEELAVVVEMNKSAEYAGACATHNYVDANMAMLAAYANLAGVDQGDVAIEDDAVQTLMNEAWDIAQRNEFQVLTSDLLRQIEALQEIQARNSPKTQAWQDASAALAPLFAEMARRQKAGQL